MKFNEKLIELRKQKGLSQEELGYKLNVTRQTVSKWELGQTTPEMDKLVEMSKVFSISVDELINESNMQNDVKPVIEDTPIQDNSKKRKIILAIIVIALIVVLVLIGMKLFARSKADDVFDQAFDIIEQAGENIDNVSDKMDGAVNQINDKINGQGENANNISSQISETQKTLDIKNFNGPIEVYNGVTIGSGVTTVLNQVVKINTTEDMKITVKYNDIETQDVEEIGNIQSEIEAFKMYKISLGYNTDGYINKVTIEKTNETMEGFDVPQLNM